MSGYAFLLVVNTAKMFLFRSSQVKTTVPGIILPMQTCMVCLTGTEVCNVAEWPLQCSKRPSVSCQRLGESHQRV